MAGPRRAIALLLGAITLVACTARPPDAAPTPAQATVDPAPTTLRWAVGDDPTSLDPSRVVGRDELAIIDALFDSLTRLTPSGVAEPALARSWEQNQDATAFTFHLRRNARWHDGRQVVAADVVRGLTRIADATGPRPSLHASLLRDVRGFEAARRGGGFSGLAATDDHTVVVRLARPSPQLPLLLAHPALAPVPVEASRDQAAFAEAPVGNGPFQLSEWLRNQFLRLTPATTSSQEPSVGELVFRVYRDDVDGEVRWADLNAGQVQVADVPIARLDELGEVQLSSDVDLTSLLVLSTARPLVRDVDFRRGLSLLVDRASSAARTNGARRPADSLVPSGLLGAPAGSCELCRHDPNRGDRLVADAVARVREGAGRRPAPLTLVTPDDQLSVVVADQLAGALLASGVVVRIDAVDPLELAETVAAEQPDIVAVPWTTAGPTSESFLRDLVAPGTLVAEATSWRPPGLQRRLRRLERASDEDARVEAVHELERFILDAAVLVPVHEGRDPLGVAADVRGFAMAADGSVDLTAVVVDDGTGVGPGGGDSAD